MDTINVYNRLAENIKVEHILKDEPMHKHTSFKIGGPVDIMVLPNSVKEVQYAIKVCKEFDIDYYVIGNGSNLLVLDGGIRGIVIKIAEYFNGVEIKGNRVTAQAGILLSSLANRMMKEGLKGFEFASGIPGTLGGAVTMNAGAYGGEMKDLLVGVHLIDDQGEVIYLKAEELELGYRSSVIQKKGFIVLSAEMEFEEGNCDEIKEKIKDFTNRRTTKQPLHLPSAGSTFKRPVGYFAGKLIEDAGLKGVRVGGAQVSPLHSGFIVNVDHATAADVIHLIKMVQKTVRDRFDVVLHSEVKVIGEAK
ncbi:UDP-N-acetylmuramate dehydrogenase [Marinisporobacter balticus]|uniref:UDP-N-acetylenolpyruvoylglucosamine reductase n=1 Tax=Marinisporobacter balticus TaxID=2018667 RepID=A0A4R2KJE0_9FIRM|nr:UDP-N-acetylmuramate dehydrogenase [Marinisporobacter balticus]TCO70719.1 UDP-N-acetylmuramate dehydrogenase [Marinisporobacter balticus]